MKLILGTVNFGIDYGISNKRGKIPKEEVKDILRFAYEKGIDILDTAYNYGNSEQVIGEIIKTEKLKFGIISKFPTKNKRNVLEVIEESLKRLNSNNIYGYMVHDFKSFLEYPEVWENIQKIKKQGKVEKIGFSLYTVKELKYILKNDYSFDIIQFPFSIFDQRFSGLLKKLKEKKVEIHIRSVFLQGLIYKNPEELEKRFIKIRSKMKRLHEVSKQKKIPLNAICINFVMLNKYIDKIVIGVENINNLKENVKFLEYRNNVKEIYHELVKLKEIDEKILLPYNW